MRSEASGKLLGKRFCIARTAAGNRRGATDGDVIGMPVGAGIVEGNNDVRAKLSDDLRSVRDEKLLWHVIQFAIAIVQARKMVVAELIGGASQLLLAPIA